MEHRDYISGRVAMEKDREELQRRALQVAEAIAESGSLKTPLDHMKALETRIAALSRRIEAYKPG